MRRAKGIVRRGDVNREPERARFALPGKDGDQTKRFASRPGLRPEDVQALARSLPELFGGAAGTTKAVVSAIQGLGLKSADSRTSNGDPTAYVDRRGTVYSSLPAVGPDQERLRTNDLASTAMESDPTAAAYVTRHAPDQAGPAADARRRADAQFATSQSTGFSGPAHIASLLKRDGDPVYRAKIVADMKADGMLDDWVESVASRYAHNGWPEAPGNAIRSAQRQGGLTSTEAQSCLRRLG